MGRFIEVKDVLGLNNERLWFYINNFNGYEVSLDGYLRSMKHWKQYPTGILLKPVQTKSDGTQIFELSNDNNERVRITIPELLDIALSDAYKHSGYPRKTIVADMSSRNIRAFITDKEHCIMPQFTVKKEESKLCPIYDLLGRSIYYGI